MEEAYTIGVVGRVHEFLLHNHKVMSIADGSRPDYNTCGGVIWVLRDRSTGRYMAQEVLMTDGSQLSLISTALRVGGKHIMGSWGAKGLLVCSDRAQASRA